MEYSYTENELTFKDNCPECNVENIKNIAVSDEDKELLEDLSSNKKLMLSFSCNNCRKNWEVEVGVGIRFNF